MAKILVICLVSACVLALGCSESEVEPANLNLEFSGDPPLTYDCDDNSRFQVTFKPYNDPGLTGDYLKMFFRLQIGDDVFYESNDIDFPLSTDSLQTVVHTLEFGGAIEGEYARDDYHIVGYLALVQNEQFIAVVTTDPRYLWVYEKTYFSKTMHIEYDCQSSYNIGADTLDTFAKLAAAFHIADTDTDFLWDEMGIPNQKVGPSDAELVNYHNAHYGHAAQGYSMHLLGVEGLIGNSDSTAGKSRSGPYGWSFIFVKDVTDYHTVKPDFALYKVTIHELGHQRGNLTHASGENPHPENHDSPFCAMNQDLSYIGNNDNNPNNDPPGLRRWFDTNPHFCDICVNTIRNITW